MDQKDFRDQMDNWDELDLSDETVESPKAPKPLIRNLSDKKGKGDKEDETPKEDETVKRPKPAISANVHIWDPKDISVRRLESPLAEESVIWVVTINNSIKFYLHNEEVKNILITKLWEKS